MYYCCKCKEPKVTLHEAIYHHNKCYNKWNRLVYSDHRVAPHNQYRRHRQLRKVPRAIHPLENLLYISKIR